MRYRLQNKGDDQGGSNSYCPLCKATGKSAHEESCEGEKIAISPTARFPRKDASEKVWKKFYDKFVLQLDLKEVLERKKKERVEFNRRNTGVWKRQRIAKNRKKGK